VKPTSNEAPSHGWLTSGLCRLLSSLIFKYDSFRLTKHENARITATIEDLYQKVHITKNPTMKKNWIGLVFVEKMCISLIKSTFNEGTLNWDVTISRVTSMTLTCAMATRSGDITKRRLDSQALPFLVYKNVMIKLAGGDKLENLVCSIKVRNAKGDK